MNILEAQIKFLLYLEAQGRSSRTIESYRVRLNGLIDRLGGVSTIAGISPHDLDSYIVSLRRRKTRYDLHPTRPQCDGGLAVATLSGRLRDIKTFFRWCVQRGLIPHSPAEHLKIPKYDPSATNRAMSLADLQKLIRATHNPRDLAIVMFLADTGARVGEIANLTPDQLDLYNGEAVVHGKTGPRIVDFTAQTSLAIQAYLQNQQQNCQQTTLWLGKNGRPLTEGGIYQVLKRLAKRAGITGRFNPHAIRHAVGQIWTDSGVNLEMIRRKLGHASVETTARYYTNQDRQREKLATVTNSLVKKIKIYD